jgi:hypothetical protein
MAFTPISYVSSNFTDYANWWLKAYSGNTTTPIILAFNAQGTPFASKMEINVNGWPITDGDAILIPYTEDAYDLWLFPTAAEADANDTTNAIKIAGNIENYASEPVVLTASTPTSLLSLSTDLPVGSIATTSEEGKEGSWIVRAWTAETDNEGTRKVDASWSTAGKYWARDYDIIRCEWFGWSSTASSSVNRAAWQSGIDLAYSEGGGTVSISVSASIDGTVRNKRGVVTQGKSGLTTVTCDFDSWTGLGLYSVPEETGFYIGQTGGSDFGEGYKQGIRDVIFVGANNTLLESYAIYAGYEDRRSITASSIAFSARNVIIDNVDVYRFDTALDGAELWESKIDKMHIAFCRTSIKLSGQSVNNSFTHINANAGRSDYTSSTDTIYGCILQAGTNYGAAETDIKRPEGNNFTVCKFNGCEDGVNISNGLSNTWDNCTIDLHLERAIFIGSSPGTVISNSYISNGATIASTIQLTNSGAATDLSSKIENCEVVNFDPGASVQQAVECPEFEGFEYVGNSHSNFQGGIVCGFQNSRSITVRDNKFKLGLSSWTGQRCVEIQGGSRIEISGNQSRDSNKIVNISTVNIPTDIHIFANSSVLQSTDEQGSLTISAAATSATVDFKQNNTGLGAGSDTGMKSIIMAICEQPGADLTVVPNGVNTNRCTFTQLALGLDNKIYYTARSVPNSVA